MDRRITHRVRKVNPFKLLVLGYVAVISAGALLLLLPFSRNGSLSVLDAVFTSTSATCVTGLIVKDTPVFFTIFGKSVILVLIQLGGLGYMSFASMVLFSVGKRGSLAMRVTVKESYPEIHLGQLQEFVKRVFVFTIIAEVIGAILLFIAFTSSGIPTLTALGHAGFNSVSAFCNAGFCTFSTSLQGFSGNAMVNAVVILQLVLGGLGFVVLEDVYLRFFKRTKRKLHLHTKVVFLSSIVLLAIGAIWILGREYTNAFRGLPLGEKVLISLFQSATPRTAGFNTIDVSMFRPGTILLTAFFMVIGGSPGGTAGGIKTTTISAAFLWLRAYFKGRERPHVLGYSLSVGTLPRVFAIVVLSVGTLGVGTLLLSLFESNGVRTNGFLPYLFEQTSAFGTVGLSTGSLQQANVSLARDFSFAGKCVIIATMIVGRAGVLSIAASLFGRKEEPIEYVEGKYIVG
jgi:trk system potassium uptake protein TrkH